VALPAFTRRMPGPQQQTCTSGFAAVGPYWDGQTERHTDGWIPYRYIDPVLYTMLTVPITVAVR